VSRRLLTGALLGAALLVTAALFLALSSDSDRAKRGAATAHGRQDWRPAPRDRGPRVEITRDDGSLPRGCGLRDVARRLADFEHALNAGDATIAAGFVAPEPQFQWYWSTLLSRTTTLRNDSFERPGELGSYFSRRGGQRERLRPLVVQVIRIAPAEVVPGGNRHSRRLQPPP
jgi:hypothetical protein